MTRVTSVRWWAPRRHRLVLAGVLGTCLVSASVADAGSAGSGSGSGSGSTVAAPTHARSPLSVERITAKITHGRITGAATIVNGDDARVRSTTGLLALTPGARGAANGLLSFRITALGAGRSTRVRFTSRRLDAMPIRAGSERVLVCADVDSQLGRFARGRNCATGPRLMLATADHAQQVGPAPKTIIETRPSGRGMHSTAVLRFASTIADSRFECRLDGAPWLACHSPHRYTGLAAGQHAFEVRAISPSGTWDATPAHAKWTTEPARSVVTLASPASGTTVPTATPTFSGTAGAAPGDSPTVRVQLFAGSSTAGSPIQTLSAMRSGGIWSMTATRALGNGTYTARAEQSDTAHDMGMSRPTTFSIDTRSSPGPDQTPAAGSTTTSTAPPTTTTKTTTTAPPTTTTTTKTTTTTTTAPPPPTYSIGGSVTGLSGGTVVLQDNGGDDLTVTGDGAFTDTFTFGGSLVTQATYDVTVKSNPLGQTCSVAQGTGTVGSANVTSVTVSCQRASDDFNRPDGDLGPGWTPTLDGGLSIASQQLVGTNVTGVSGDTRAGEGYGSDQYSQIELTSTPLSDGEWIGPSVRGQNDGQDMYLGVYFVNADGTPQLALYARSEGQFSELGAPCDLSGPLPAGTQITVSASGSQISLLENGVPRISATDTTLTGGAPGVMAYGAASAGNWVGGGAPMDVQYDHTDSDGIAYYDFTAGDDGYGPQVLRILSPTDPAPGVPHNFLYVLPVEPGQGTTYGDGIETLLGLDAQNKYNLTIVEPSFTLDPWYADNPNDANLRYDTFMTDDLVPWIRQNFSTSGQEQNWLIGFSKSGIGGQDLILRHPDVFTLAASWDFPADMSSYDQFGTSSADNYGTDANFQANYQLSPSFLDAHNAPFLSENRIWIGGDTAFPGDMADYDTLLTQEGIEHTTEASPTNPNDQMDHTWDSGWVPDALRALSQDSANLPATP